MPSNPNRAPSHTPAARALSRAFAALHDEAYSYVVHVIMPDMAKEAERGLERAALRYAAAVARAAAEGAKR